ncbi:MULTISPECIES: replication protein P [unclassified Providencia]|uniref:replication protein P n=1 Tax=unclassified Providencia TaxID=2633465 RepID=UPI0023496910|nr:MULTISPECIES: replication protein P [unclassified Providencia]
MKSLLSAIETRDSKKLSSLIQPINKPTGINEHAEKLVDMLFDNLVQIFPAAKYTVFLNQDDISATKRQWVLAFIENGITSVEQLKAGMSVARQQESDFFPSCGKFISWCREGMMQAMGLPSVCEVMAEMKRYSNLEWRYPSVEAFPWKSTVMYWIVPEARRRMTQYNLSDKEIRESIKKQLIAYYNQIQEGKPIPPIKPLIGRVKRGVSTSELIDKEGKYRLIGEEAIKEIRDKILCKKGNYSHK